MSNRNALPLRSLIAAAFLAAASCSKPAPPSDAAKTQDAKAANLSPGGLAPLPMYLEDLVTDATQFASYVASVEAATPRQNGHVVTISKNPQVTCTGAKARLTFQTYSTAGEYQFGELTAGDGKTNFGYAVAVVDNETACQPISIPLPAQTTSDGGSAILFVAIDKATSAFKMFVVDSTTRAILAKYDFKACDPGGKHPWFGDHTMARKYGDQCDHMKPSPTLAVTAMTARARTTASPALFVDNIDNPWTAWVSCGADCCYADTGGTGIGIDSTRRDSTHRDTTHHVAPAKPAKSGET